MRPDTRASLRQVRGADGGLAGGGTGGWFGAEAELDAAQAEAVSAIDEACTKGSGYGFRVTAWIGGRGT